jgi:hypothetical protein
MKMIIHSDTIQRANRLANRATRNLQVTRNQLRDLRDEFVSRIVERLERKFPA